MEDYLMKMMDEHHGKTLADWLAATSHLDAGLVESVYNEWRSQALAGKRPNLGNVRW